MASSPSQKGVLLGALTAFAAWGLGFYGPAVFLKSLPSQSGLDAEDISLLVTLHFLWAAVVVSQLDTIHERLTLRGTCLAGACALAVGVNLWVWSTTWWMLLPAAILTGFGWATLGSAAVRAIVVACTTAGPGALARALNGASAAGVVCAPAWVYLATHGGLRQAAAIMSFAAFGIMVAVSVWLGEQRTVTRKPLVGGRSLVASRAFALLAAGVALAHLVQIGTIIHFLARLAASVGPEMSAWLVSATTAATVVSRFYVGHLIERIGIRRCGAIGLGGQAVAIAVIGIATDPAIVAPACLAFGFGGAVLSVLLPTIAAEEFGGEVARVVAMASGISQFIWAFGPAFVGLLYALYGYPTAFAIMSFLQVVSAILILTGRRRAGIA